jgi:hypothetical protein
MSHLDLSAKYGETTFSNYEIYMIGEALVCWMGTTARLGHSSPGSVLDYTKNPELLGLGGLIVRDFVAWTSGCVDKSEGCETRMRELIASSALDTHLAAKGAPS